MMTRMQCGWIVLFLLGHAATATTWMRPVDRTVVVTEAEVVSFPRGGGGNDTWTQPHQQRNTTSTTSWVNQFQRRLWRRNPNRRGTTTNSSSSSPTMTTGDNHKDVPDRESHKNESPIILQTASSSSSSSSNNRTTGSWFQQRQPWRNRHNNVTTTDQNSTTTARNKPPRSISHDDATSTNTTLSTTTPPTTPSNSTTTTTTTTNRTTTSNNNNNNNNADPLPPAHGVMVMGSPPPPPATTTTLYSRGAPVIIRSANTAANPTASSSNSVAIVLIELVSVVLGKVMYLWFFTWLAKHLAQQEEGMILPTQHYVWERLNDRYSRDAVALKTVLREPPLGVSTKQWHRQHVRQVLQTDRRRRSTVQSVPPTLAETFTRTVVVVELSAFGGSNAATIDFKALPDVISFLLQQQRQHAFGTSKVTGAAMPLEIVFLVNSPGGEVSTYGLAAAQMRRLKQHPDQQITTTVCVDQYAASGGFMIASQADKLVAAPFATIGSVGVILEGLNFYELAKRYGIQPLVIKAGESKRPLSQWGPVTRQDLAQEQSRLGKVHEAFKEFVTEGRPGIVEHAQQVMDGSVYLGLEAQKLGLIDVVMTTDEYIFDRIEAGDRVLRLRRSQQGLFNRQLRVSPLDILPHLRSWLSSALQHGANKGERGD